MVGRRNSDPVPYQRVRTTDWRSWIHSIPYTSYPLVALLAVFAIYLVTSTGYGQLFGSDDTAKRYIPTSLPRPPRQPNTRSGKPRTQRLQVIQAGGIPKEGMGSTITFMREASNIAYLLDADFIISQTALMFDDYRVSDIVNRNSRLESGGRVCDIMEVLLHNPSDGHFQERMDRAQDMLDELYERSIKICQGELTGSLLLSEYARKELDRCDTLIINDYRIKYGSWTPCSRAWWQDVLDGLAERPAHGNDVAIHFRWGDMYDYVQKDGRWRFDMEKVAPLVDIIRQENPSVVVNVYMKPSKQNESEKRMREILKPLSGDFNIIESSDDVEELSLMSQARYLFINGGTFSTAAAASGHAQVVIHNNGQGVKGNLPAVQETLDQMRLRSVFNYEAVDLDKFRAAVRP